MNDDLPEYWTPTYEQAALDIAKLWMRTVDQSRFTADGEVTASSGDVLNLVRSAYAAGRADALAVTS